MLRSARRQRTPLAYSSGAGHEKRSALQRVAHKWQTAIMQQKVNPDLFFSQVRESSCRLDFEIIQPNTTEQCITLLLLSLPRCNSLAGLGAGSKYGGGGGPLAVSPTSASAGPKSESAPGLERHHAAAKALTSTKVCRACCTCLHVTCSENTHQVRGDIDLQKHPPAERHLRR